MKYSEIIKNLRAKMLLTQTEFASILGVSVKTIEKWEQGSIEPRPMVKKFLYLLNMHPVLFNDLYSFESHEKTDNQYVIKYTSKISFTDEFKVKSLSDNPYDKIFKPIKSEYTPEIRTNNLITKDCCPAS